MTAAVAGADLVVLHLGFGGRPGEQTDLTCDRGLTNLTGGCNLAMFHNQSKMLETVLATGKPVIIVLFTTLPMNITALVPDKRVNAILQAYYPQHHGGQAIVDVITGHVNPSARLVATWPKEYVSPCSCGRESRPIVWWSCASRLPALFC